MSKQLPRMTKGLPSTRMMQVRGSSAVPNRVFSDSLRKPSHRALIFVSAEELTLDKKKKGIYFLVITELSLFCTPDNKTHNDAENPPDHKIGTEEKDEQ